MKRTAARSSATWEAHRDGAGEPCAPKHGGRLVYDLVKAYGGEVGELHLHDGAHALERGADGRADHCVFADWRVENAVGKALGKGLSGLESATESANILTIDVDARVVFESLALRFADGFEIVNQAGGRWAGFNVGL